MVDFSSEKYSGSTGKRNSFYQHFNFKSGIRCRDSSSQPLGYEPSALAIELRSSKAIAGKEQSLSNWYIALIYIYHFSTVVDFSLEKSCDSTGHRNFLDQQENLFSEFDDYKPRGYKPSAVAIELRN